MTDEDDAKGLEDVSPKHREVALRLRRLMKALGLKQDKFAEAADLRRTEMNTALNGGNLATSRRWINGIAKAAGTSAHRADAYLRGDESLKSFILHLHKAPPDETFEELLASIPVIEGHKIRVYEVAAQLGYPAEIAREVNRSAALTGSVTDEEIGEMLLTTLRANPKVLERMLRIVEDDSEVFGGLARSAPKRRSSKQG